MTFDNVIDLLALIVDIITLLVGLIKLIKSKKK